LLGNAFILSQGLFSFPCSARQGGAQEMGREHSQDSWLKLTKGIFHTIWHHAQYINGGELGLLLRGEMGINHSVVSNCTVHCPLCVFYYHCYYLLLYCPVKRSLSQPRSFTFFFFSDSAPHPTGAERGVSEWLRGA